MWRVLALALAVAASASPRAFPAGKLILGYAPQCDPAKVPPAEQLGCNCRMAV
jgi:hypothetical protein